MPVMDGYEFTEHIRSWELENHHYKSKGNQSSAPDHLPILALTASTSSANEAKCMKEEWMGMYALPFYCVLHC